MIILFFIIISILFLLFLYYYTAPTTNTTPNNPDWSYGLPVIEMENLEKTNTEKWKMEGLCRKILEKTFDKKFPSTRPNFLKNPSTGYNLELDCFNSELKLALEYNGIQHYHYPNKFHKTRAEFDYQLEKDQLKSNLCKQNNITLITIPYTIKKSELISYITNELTKEDFIHY